MWKLPKIWFFLVLMIFSGNIFGQVNTVNTNEPPTRRNTEEEQYLKSKTPHPTHYFRMSEEYREKFVLSTEMAKLNNDRRLLIVAPEYYEKYADFLTNKKTGLARLHSEKNCYLGKTVSVDEAERCADALPIIGNGSFYSFRMKSNLKYSAIPSLSFRSPFQLGGWEDIHYVNNKFEAGGETVLGIITELKDIDLQKMNDKHKYIKSLKSYKSKKKFEDVERQKKLINQGISLGGVRYSNSVSVKMGSTYLLRSIAYIVLFRTPHPEYVGQIYSGVEIRTDAITGFQVVGQEEDGSIIILWKQFSSKDAPVMILK